LAGVSEILLLSVVYYRIFDSYRDILGMDLFHFRGKFFLIGLYIIISYLTFHVCESFSFDKLKAFDLSISQCISCIIINGITWLQLCLVVNGLITPGPLIKLTLIDFVICILYSLVFTAYFRKNGGIEDALMICGSEEALSLKDKMDRKEGSFSVAETVFSYMAFSDILKAVDRHNYVVINDVPAELRNDILKYCYGISKSTYIVPKLTDIMVKGTDDISTFDTPMLLVSSEGLNPIEAFLKRLVDLLVSGLVMIPGSLLMLAIALAIKLEDGGPVFYTQKRVTKGGKPFDILKFRSMIVNAEEATGAVLACEDDPRITRVGKFLRSCRLDEFPQFLNILKGDMSLVGPRPERVELAEEIMQEMPEFAYRTKVKAGLTGYAQVYGKYNTNNYDKLRLDLIYIEQYSVLLDIKLMLMTPQILFRKEATEGVKREDAESTTRAAAKGSSSEASEGAGRG